MDANPDTSGAKITILVGNKVGVGEVFQVAGFAGGMAEAVKICQGADFVKTHGDTHPGGFTVLLVNDGGHKEFIPLGRA